VVDNLNGFGYQIMMTLGSLVNPEDLGDLPRDFFTVPYASGKTLASRADAIVCHAGNGTAYQALLSGIPIITWPSVKDQYWNARRLNELGVCVNISSGAELIKAVEEVLGNPAYRKNALNFSEILKKYNGPQFSAQLIRIFLENIEN
jgi:UDP:flavonoid glycosyltransferase YjiC (YdhE family)